jgi:tetratricopeptide (TPR) repeat protein
MVQQKDEKEFPGGISPAYLGSLKNDDPQKCPPPELLTRFHGGELTGRARRKIEDHVVYCPVCLTVLEALRNAEEPGAEKALSPRKWRMIEKSLDQKFRDRMREMTAVPLARRTSREKAAPAGAAVKTRMARLKDFLSTGKLVYAGAFGVVLIAGLYAYAYLDRDRFFTLARVEPEKTLRLRSGPDNSALGKGLDLYGRGKYGRAIVQFETCLKANPDQYTPLYYLALSRLGKAEVRMMGLGYRFDGLEAGKAIAELQKALLQAGDNNYFRADCHWHLGKAFLMQGEVKKAGEHFSGVLRLRWDNIPHRDEAEKMLSRLQEMQ